MIPIGGTSSASDIVHRMLSNYVGWVREGDCLSRINRRLRIATSTTERSSSSSTSSSKWGAPRDAREYYANRSDLKSYTLGVELGRDADYTLIRRDGSVVTDKGVIRDYFRCRRKDHDNDVGWDEEGREDDGICTAAVTYDRVKEEEEEEEELLIRAANQSLFADGLLALTGDEGVLLPGGGGNDRHPSRTTTTTTTTNWVDRLVLTGPILSMSCIVERCHYAIDLHTGNVEGICVLAVSVPDEYRRLVLARGILVARFSPGRGGRPSSGGGRTTTTEEGGGGGGRDDGCGLRYEMQMVKAHHHPGSRALYDVASSLGRDIDRLRLQDGDGGGDE
jgi:hypothetical protein